MKTTYTKEQAEQVFLDLQRFIGFDCLTEIEIKFLNHKFPSLEVGKWYKITDYPKSYLVWNEGNNTYGFWRGIFETDWTFDHNFECTPATDKEVEEALIAEAKRRGYKDGVRLKNEGINKRYDWELKVNWSRIKYIPNRNVLDSGDGHIFDNGQWAEIINDPTKDKIAELEATINKAQQELKELKGLVD